MPHNFSSAWSGAIASRAVANNSSKGKSMPAVRPLQLMPNSREVVQLVKMYNHSKKLYVNDEDHEAPPTGYQLVSATQHNIYNGEWTSERVPSRYYLGSGDLSRPSSFYSGEVSQGRHPKMTVTTYDSAQQAGGKYGTNYNANRQQLEHMGVQVKDKVDATNPDTMSDTEYDEVHFEFPHTGDYGGTTVKDQKALASNTGLMTGTMSSAKKKLRPGGSLRISEGNFPYRNSTIYDKSTPGVFTPTGVRVGMNLDQMATSIGYTVTPSNPLGTEHVGRTSGGYIDLPNSVRHNYRLDGTARVQVTIEEEEDEENRGWMAHEGREIVALCERFHGRLVSSSQNSITVETTEAHHNELIYELQKSYGYKTSITSDYV
ncbi:Rossmann-like fold-containing protein [Dinghuibacter silviterrae]|uniref:Uncharacterized protein DUF2431 n=1 Tax=Dinghuibacter silviterrae TaxID=1539049 RepID=A0A4R8DG04_9BACT|nr:Rossmann-like fold-containing protein [Dinghuibacter silviterrae]TDW95890.1 uncharacterized protein DUF2431 [Dinghuibacter silviterrae]